MIFVSAKDGVDGTLVDPGYWALIVESFGPKEFRESLRVLGEKAAAAIGRETPFSTSTVDRFFLGEQVTYEVVRAFAALAGLPNPVLRARTPEEAQWFVLLQWMHDNRPAVLGRAMRKLAGIRETLEKEQALEREILRTR